MKQRSDKAKTNAQWTSNDEYRDNYDRIFGKKVNKDKESEEKSEDNKPETEDKK